MTDLFEGYQKRLESTLNRAFEQFSEVPEPLLSALKYSVFNGGKRVRPTLVYLAAESLGAKPELADSAAAAIELIHCYSLVHDDLPAMDDDDLRRGNPTVHIRFDEATAVLAGDALQAMAFGLIANDQGLSAEVRIGILQRVAEASGPVGMVGGQVLDLQAESQNLKETELSRVHHLKTGALIAASAVVGALIGGADSREQAQFAQFGYALGLAFQVKDDILDVTGDTEKMGKQQGADQNRNKSTYVTALGLEQANARLEGLIAEAQDCVKSLGNRGSGLAELARFVAERNH